MKIVIALLFCVCGIASLQAQITPQAIPQQQPTSPVYPNVKPVEHPEYQNLDRYRLEGTATRGYRGRIVPYEIWIDEKTWIKEEEPFNPGSEMAFRLKNQSVFASVFSKNARFDLAKSRDLIIKDQQGDLRNPTIITETMRIVNGNVVVMIHWKGLLSSKSTDFLSYVYSGPFGTVMIHVFTPSEVYENSRLEMEKFLNGLVLPQEKRPS